MLSWFMKSSVQSLFGNVFYLPRPDSGFSNNPFPSYHMPVTPIPSSTYALFSVTALPQLPWNQQLPDSFYRHGGCTPARDPFFFSQPPTPKRTNHESARTQLQFARIARQSRQSEVPSRHRLRTAVPPSRHPFRSLFSPCHFATAISSTRRGRPFRRLPR